MLEPPFRGDFDLHAIIERGREAHGSVCCQCFFLDCVQLAWRSSKHGNGYHLKTFTHKLWENVNGIGFWSVSRLLLGPHVGPLFSAL